MKRFLMTLTLTFLTSFGLLSIIYGIIRTSDHQNTLIIIGLITLVIDIGFIYWTYKKGFWKAN